MEDKHTVARYATLLAGWTWWCWKQCWDDALVFRRVLKASIVWKVDGSVGNTFQSLVLLEKKELSMRHSCIVAAQYERHGLWFLWQTELGWEGNIDLVIAGLVPHSQAAVSAMLFQGWPSQVLNHSGGTAVIIMVACDIPGRVALDLFKLVGVPADVWVPDTDSGSVLDSRLCSLCSKYLWCKTSGSGKKSMVLLACSQIESTWLLKVSLESVSTPGSLTKSTFLSV